MMSTPIDKLRRDDEVDDSADELDHDDGVVRGASVRNHDDALEGCDDESDDLSRPDTPAPAKRGVRAMSTRLPSRKQRRSPSVAQATLSGDTSTLLEIVCSANFAKAVALTFALICAVLLSPVVSWIRSKLPVINSIPRIETILASLLSAIAVTAARPPPIV